MNFKLNLNEDLFDTPDFMFDDKFDFDHDLEDVLPGPAEGADTGVANELIALINDEWEAIQGYNNAIATFRANIASNPFYQDAVNVLEEISAEENRHVGQLQEVLKRISPNTADIEKGHSEAESQLGLVNGKLPVQSWTPQNTSTTENALVDDTICTLCDVDDEM